MAADEEGFFEDWPKWSKPVFALSAMILLGGVQKPPGFSTARGTRSCGIGKAGYAFGVDRQRLH